MILLQEIEDLKRVWDKSDLSECIRSVGGVLKGYDNIIEVRCTCCRKTLDERSTNHPPDLDTNQLKGGVTGHAPSHTICDAPAPPPPPFC